MFISSKVNVISASLSLAGFADDVEVFALRLQDSRKQKAKPTNEGHAIASAVDLFNIQDPTTKIVTIKKYTEFSKATDNPFRCQEGDVAGNRWAAAPIFVTTEENARKYGKTKFLQQWNCDKLLHVLTGTEFVLVNLRNMEFLKDFVSYYKGDNKAVNSIKLMTGYDVTDRDQYKLAKKYMEKLQGEYQAERNKIEKALQWFNKQKDMVSAKYEKYSSAIKSEPVKEWIFNKISSKQIKSAADAYKIFDLRKLEEKIMGRPVSYDGDDYSYITGGKVDFPEDKNKDTLNRLCLDANDKQVLRLLKKFVEDKENESYKNVMGYFWVGDKEEKNWWHSEGRIIDEVALFQQYVVGEDRKKKALWITNADKYLNTAKASEATTAFLKKTSEAFLEKFPQFQKVKQVM